MMITRVRMLPTVSLTALAIAAPALAQETTGNVDDGGIREIVVTAQKREESIQAIPIAVTALDRRSLESATVEDLRDIAGRVPSLVVDNVNAGPSAAAIAIRGISFEDIEKSFDPAVGVVLDGVFIGTNTGQMLDSFDLERIEVLRGPQGTLFGRNTIGGVINVIRTSPTDEFGVRGQFGYSRFDSKRGRLVVNTGKIGDILALKAFGYYDKTDGFYYNATLDRRAGKYETLTGGVTALITPTDTINAEITYQHTRERGESVGAPLSDARDLICAAPGVPGFAAPEECGRWSLPAHGLYTTFQNIETPVRNNLDSVIGNVDFTLSDALTLYSVTGYMHNKESVRQDFDGTSANFFDTLRLQTYRQFSQELRLVADLDSVNLLVGGYYFNSNYKLDQFTNFGPVLGQGAPAVLRQYVDHTAKSYAAFADAQIDVTENFAVSVGARYTKDKKDIFNNYGRIGALVGITMPTFDGKSCVDVTGLLDLGEIVIPAYGAANNCTADKSFNKFTWRANAEYTLEPGKLVYASFSRGFRSGGFNGRAASPTSLGPYEPETVDAYEVGLKADWLDRRLRTNFAFYYTKYNNKQEEVVQPAPPGSASPQETVVKNASSADIKGFEAEVIAQVTSDLNFTASFAYTDAQYNNFVNDIVGLTPGSAQDGIPDDVSTLTLRRAPKYSWSVGANYSKEVGSGRIDASTLLRFQSKYMTCIAPNKPVIPGSVVNDNRCLTEDRENLSAQIGYTHFLAGKQEISFSIFGRNLTDHRGLSSTLPVAGLFTFGAGIQPRTYGVEVGFRF